MSKTNHLSANQEKGMLLERALDRALTILKIPHKTNPLDARYSNRSLHGVEGSADGAIMSRDGTILYECKNENEENWYWSNSHIEERILKHFRNISALMCILICSFCKSYKVLRDEGINIIELGYQVTSENFNQAIHDLIRKLAFIKKKFKFYVPQPRKHFLCLDSKVYRIRGMFVKEYVSHLVLLNVSKLWIKRISMLDYHT